MKALFVISIFFIFYAYLGYPLSLFLLSLIYKKRVYKNAVHPNTTLIVAVYNEEMNIRRKIENMLQVQYPKEKLQILIVSDGSTDRTNEIIKTYEDLGVELLMIPERKGKNEAQGRAVERSKGDILVFTDTATMIEPNGLKEIIYNFADPRIGCVSSEDRLISQNGKVSGENYYVRYEMILRNLESKINSIVGASGSFFAARKEVCSDFIKDPHTVSDFKAVLNSVKIGLRAVNDPLAVGHYEDLLQKNDEYRRKIRTVIRGLTEFFHHPELLNIFRYGLFSYQYFCHKLLRWLAPFFLCSLFISSIFLSMHNIIFHILLICQIVFYCVGLFSLKLRDRTASSSLINVPEYFVLSNAAIMLAWWRYFKGDRISKWDPSRRGGSAQ